MDRRGHERLWIQLRCAVRPPGKKGLTTLALTQNISRGGILLRWPPSGGVRVPDVGDIVHADISLPTIIRFGERCLHCVGEVVRVTSGDGEGELLVALHFQRMRLKPVARQAVPEMVM